MGVMDNIGYFTLDGHDTTEWGIGLSGTGVWDAPARKGESISVPGRNGNIWVDDGSFENILVTYPCWIPEGFDNNIDGFRTFLALHSHDYFVLRDTYHPNEHRLARYAGPFTTTPGTRNLTGRFDVVFDCMPQRFLDSGNSWRNFAVVNPAEVLMSETNPTGFTSSPVFCISVSQNENAGLLVRTRVSNGGTLLHSNHVKANSLAAGTYYYIDTANMTLREGSTADSVSWESFDLSSCKLYIEPETASDHVIAFFNGYNSVTNMTAHLSHFSILTRYWQI